MQTYTPRVEEMVNETARKIVALARVENGLVTAKFNDIELIANPLSRSKDIMQFYEAELARRSAQSKVTEAMAELSTLDFSSFVTVINWLEKIRNPFDRIGVNIPYNHILVIFHQHGFKAGENCGDKFNGEDEENFARWLIGETLSDLECGDHFIHQVFHKFANDWRKKFWYA